MKNVRHAFTLIEAVLVVAVLAILVGMSFPAVTRYIQKSDVQLEQNRMTEIKSGLRAYLADKNQVPSKANWAAELAGGYTNLSQDQILNDVWGHARAYRAYTDNTRLIQGSAIPINYISLHSMGIDGVPEAVSGVAVTSGQYSSSNTGWWNDSSTLTPTKVTDAFSVLVAGGDDVMIKITDYAEKLDKYEQTVQRIDRITDALQVYARTQYSNKVAACAANPASDVRCTTPGALETIIYFPRSQAAQGVEQADGSVYNYLSSTIIVDNNRWHSNLANRRKQMQNLMKMLGLPTDYCCSALGVAADGLPEPFFYFSNPRQRLIGASGCDGRPWGTQPKLSPRIVTTYIEDASPEPTCG